MNGYLNTVSAEMFKLRHKRRSYVMAGLLWLLLPALLLLIGWILQTRVAGTFADGDLSIAQVVQKRRLTHRHRPEQPTDYGQPLAESADHHRGADSGALNWRRTLTKHVENRLDRATEPGCGAHRQTYGGHDLFGYFARR